MLDLQETPKRRRLSLTPMIDVVFLLLVFFMLAARFQTEMVLPLAAGGGSDGGEGAGESAYDGPPRFVEFGADGALRLNGFPLEKAEFLPALEQLMTKPDDIVVIRPDDTATSQDLVNLIGVLKGSGIDTLALVE